MVKLSEQVHVWNPLFGFLLDYLGVMSNVNPKHKTCLIYINKISFLRGLVKSKFIIFFICPYTSGQVPCKKPFSTWIFPWKFSKASTIRSAICKPWLFRTPRLCFPWKSSHRLCPSDPGGSNTATMGKTCGYINHDMLMDDIWMI